MNHYDAARILNITMPATNDDITSAYRKAAMKFHPDRNPAGQEMMKMVNVAYAAIKDDTSLDLGGYDNDQAGAYPEELSEALNAIINLDGLDIEICGSWVWVGGNTKDHKDAIKAAGFKWAKKKVRWYYRPAEYKSRGRGKFSMEDIRVMHGSSKPQRTYRKAIAA